VRHGVVLYTLEMCIGMGKTGIPWIPWDSRGNGNTISRVMGMGIRCMGMGINRLEWGKSLHTLTSKHLHSQVAIVLVCPYDHYSVLSLVDGK